MFFATGCHQASELSERLGCKRIAKGGVVTDPDTEESSVPGVYVAGDVSRDVLLERDVFSLIRFGIPKSGLF